MRILITGGFGFIGGRLAAQLSTAGHEVTLASRRNVSSPNWLPMATVVPIEWESNHNLEEICTDSDVVIHAAGMNSKECEINPGAAHEFNGEATGRLVRAAVNVHAKTFVYLSTAHVYANPLRGKICETSPTTNTHPYATSHLQGELEVLRATKSGRTSGRIVRLSNVFGAPTHAKVNCWMLLINDLCKQAVTTHELLLYNPGPQERDFISMEDACASIGLIALLDSPPSKNFPSLINIGAGISFSVLQIATLVQQRCAKVLGFQPSITYPPLAIADSSSSLEYQSLYSSHFKKVSENHTIDEIDRLLKFCKESFSAKLA